MAMKKISWFVVAFFAIAAPAFAGVGIDWTTRWGGYTHDAPDTISDPSDYFIEEHYTVIWQLVHAGPNGVIDPPDPFDAANGYVSGDDQVWAQRTIPLGGGTAPEDGTIWEDGMWWNGGDTIYWNEGWSTTGFVYMRVYEGTPIARSWYYDTPLYAYSTNCASKWDAERFYVESDLSTGGFQPNQQVFGSGEVWVWVSITNADETVAFSVSNLTVGGTGDSRYSGLDWHNNLTGGGHISDSWTSWSFNCALGVGTNVIKVKGYGDWYLDWGGSPYQSYGVDTLVVVRSAAPRLDITNANAVVAIGTSNLTVGGTSSGLTGAIGWTNRLGGSGSLAAAASWSFTSPLQFGTNVITARGTNSFGEAASGTVEVVRSETLGPRLDVTYAGDTRNFLLTIPAGYRLGSVSGADMEVEGAGFVWSNLTEGLHYAVSGSNVTIQPVGPRKLIRMGLTFP